MLRSSSCLAIGLTLSCFACHQPQSPTSLPDTGIPERLASNAKGFYKGHYSKGLLTLVINYLNGTTVSGYDIHKGLRRNLNGQVEQKGGLLSFTLKEPGGNPYDGTFYLSLDTASSKISGQWIPGDSTKAHAGPLDLSKMEKSDDEYADYWEGELGDLYLYPDGSCRLEYYPSSKDNAQLITVRGNYERKDGAILIEWQRNDRTPVLNMKLTETHHISATDSTETSPPILSGNGVSFTKSMAG